MALIFILLRRVFIEIKDPIGIWYLNELYCVTFAFSAGYGFFVASQLTGDTKKIFDSIEDVVAQADEVDDKYLQVSMRQYYRCTNPMLMASSLLDSV